MLALMTMADAARSAPERVASVLLPLPLPEAFDYAEPAGLGLELGQVVEVPLGPRAACGVVTALRSAEGVNRALKPVLSVLEVARLPPTTLAFVEWAARYAVDSPGQALAIALRGLRGPGLKPEKRLRATGRSPDRLTPARHRVLAAAAEPVSRSELRAASGASAAVIAGLVRAGALEVVSVQPEPAWRATRPIRRDLERLNPSQAAAAEVLEQLRPQGFGVALLDGVTGSGKTEVILEAVAGALAGRA